MAAKLSKEVTDRTRTCLRVLSAFDTEGGDLSQDLLGVAQPHLEEEDESPAFFPVIVALGRTMRGALNRLISADKELYAASAEESFLRSRYKQLVERLALLIVGLRRIVIGHYVDPNLEGLGLQPVDARESIVVMRRSELIGERFESEDVLELLGEPRFAQPDDVNKHVDEVRSASSEVRELTEQINKASRVTAKARLQKNDLRNEYDRMFLRSARIFEDFCRVVGRDEAAEQVRQSVAASRTAQQPDEVPSDGDDPSADPQEIPPDVPEAPAAAGGEASQEVAAV